MPIWTSHLLHGCKVPLSLTTVMPTITTVIMEVVTQLANRRASRWRKLHTVHEEDGEGEDDRGQVGEDSYIGIRRSASNEGKTDMSMSMDGREWAW